MTRILTSLALVLTLCATESKADIVKINTAAGVIQVSSSISAKLTAFISDVVARGFKGHINCLAHGGHVPGSRHYSGNACDFAQRGWNKTVHVMYHVSDLAKKHGLRDGCSFGDCGHIDDGQRLARSRHTTRFASKKIKIQYADVSGISDRFRPQ